MTSGLTTSPLSLENHTISTANPQVTGPWFYN